jgi:hypothetical protein
VAYYDFPLGYVEFQRLNAGEHPKAVGIMPIHLYNMDKRPVCAITGRVLTSAGTLPPISYRSVEGSRIFQPDYELDDDEYQGVAAAISNTPRSDYYRRRAQ